MWQKGAATPSIPGFLSTWSFDPVAAVAIVIAAVLYAVGLTRARRAGVRWGAWPTIAFYLFGLGSYAWIQFGFLGTWSHDLRWAFTTRVAFLLFLTPALMALGRPVGLARVALGGASARVLDAVLGSWPVRLAGNAIFAPVVALVGFSLFLTPFAAALRLEPGWEWAITLGVPLIGLLMALPIAEDTKRRTSLFIMVEFLLAFAELILDAIPGILLRLNNAVLDHAPAVTGTLPAWFPNPLHDQHLSGDFLWFIAEVADVPILIALFVRWTRVDRTDAKKVDDLSDEEYEAAIRAHLGR